VKKNRRSLLYYYLHLSTIPDEKRFFVKDAGSRKNVAMLDEAFVAEHLVPGVVFIARGKPWKVLSVSDDEVVVEASQHSEGAVPDWEGEESPVEEAVAQEGARVLGSLCAGKLPAAEAREQLKLSPSAAKELEGFSAKQAKFFTPSPTELVLETRGAFLVLHSFHGLRCNQALARALSFLLTGQMGASVRVHATPYAVLFEFAGNAPVQKFEQTLRSLKSSEFEHFLRAGLTGTPLFRWRWTHVAKRFGFLRKDAELSAIGIRKLAENTRDSVLWQEAFAELFFDDFDADAAADLLHELEKGTARLLLLSSKEHWSPLAKLLLEHGGLGELLQPQEPTEQLLEAFKEHVLGERSGLVCLFCGSTWSRKVREHPEHLKCPQCGSNQVTLEEYKEVADLQRQKKALKPDERRKLEEALRVASHISAYGKRALAAFATYGVGPESASRVLSRLRPSERELYGDLYAAQINFIKTRRFWKV
jgi:ATP-dependent Lhr-like helicase